MSIFKFLDNIENEDELVVRQSTTSSRPTRNINARRNISQQSDTVRHQENNIISQKQTVSNVPISDDKTDDKNININKNNETESVRKNDNVESVKKGDSVENIKKDDNIENIRKENNTENINKNNETENIKKEDIKKENNNQVNDFGKEGTITENIVKKDSVETENALKEKNNENTNHDIKNHNDGGRPYSHVQALKEKAKKNRPPIEQKPQINVESEPQEPQNNALLDIFNQIINNAKTNNQNGSDDKKQDDKNNNNQDNNVNKVVNTNEPSASSNASDNTRKDVKKDNENKPDIKKETENNNVVDKTNNNDKVKDDDEDDEDDEDDIDLEGMKKAFSNMYTNIEIAPVSISEKYRQMREEMEAKRKGKKSNTSSAIADKLNAKKTHKDNIPKKAPPAQNQTINTSVVSHDEKPKVQVENTKQYSEIVALTTTRPIEIAYDLDCRYLEGQIVKFNKYAKNSDFAELVNQNIDMKYLDISCCNMLDDFSPLLKLENVEQLDISGCRNFNDLSLLSNMKKLKVLNLGLLNIESIDNLPDFPDLEVLSLKLLKVKDIKILSKYPKLHDLVLWCCSSIISLDGIEGLAELRMLDLDSCTGIKTLEPIRNLNKLVHLNLNFLKIEDLSPIQNLTNIESFAMEFSPLALTEQNLSYFEKLIKIKFLGLRNRLIRKLDYFKDMTQMSDLELGGNIINDLRPLENMIELKTLNLGTNSNLLDISPLHKMAKLQKLNLSGTSTPRGGRIEMIVGDLSVVKELKSLTSFESNFNKKLRDITPLQYCANLEEFSANNCLSLADISPLRFCTKLKSISVENCVQIRDMSFFKYLTELSQINISKTSVDRLLMSDWTRLYGLGGIKDSSTNVLINNIIMDSLKYRKKVAKVVKSTVKDEDNK